jgi:Tol biopolymer transport system component
VIEIHQPDGGVTTTLVTAPDVGSVAWTPDGRTIMYTASSVPGGRFALHVIGTDGKDDRVVYTARFAPPTLLSMRWSPAGDLLAVVSYDDSDAGPSSTIELFDRTYAHVGTLGPFDGTGAFFTWSPDGRSVLATSPMAGGTRFDARIAPLGGGESRLLDLPSDYFTACPIAWGAATP